MRSLIVCVLSVAALVAWSAPAEAAGRRVVRGPVQRLFEKRVVRTVSYGPGPVLPAFRPVAAATVFAGPACANGRCAVPRK